MSTRYEASVIPHPMVAKRGNPGHRVPVYVWSLLERNLDAALANARDLGWEPPRVPIHSGTNIGSIDLKIQLVSVVRSSVGARPTEAGSYVYHG
jgi:hypothetical protein